MTFFVFSLGCKVNSYECAAIKSALEKEGYSEDKTNPDIVIINTCSVTSTADQKSRQHIRKFRLSYPKAILVVMGCYAQRNANYIQKECHADIIIGTSNRHRIIEFIERFKNIHQPIVEIGENPRLFCYEELGVTTYSENVRAYLKISDGCNNFCSYCLIPYIRGRLRSRKYEDIILEAKNLIANGYQEIVLTGIHVGGYGQDNKSQSFSCLVKDLLALPGLSRLRISSIEESEIDDQLIALCQNNDKLAKHLHIPLQSGSSTVLRRMNRKYDASSFLNKLSAIRKACPSICLTTDVIVGFPQETEEEFLQTVELIKACSFNMLHVFPFSPRAGTKAYEMEGQIPPYIKKQRVDTLLTLSKKLWDDYCKSFVGKEVEMLVETYNQETKMSYGHSSNYLPCKMVSNFNNVGQLVIIIYK